ncbi:MAG: glutathione S-transferase family protein [Pikeienuella sp.]
MAEFRLHCFAEAGNAYKIALMLALTKADWEPVLVDVLKGETAAPDFLALNPMGEVPVLEHLREGAAGPRPAEVIAQSGAILDYLSIVLGAFDPGPENAREALRWILWDNYTLTSKLAPWRVRLNLVPPDQRVPEEIHYLQSKALPALAVLDRHLESRDWIAAPWMTTADLSCAGEMFFSEQFPIDWEASYPALVAWRERIRALEGWAHPYDLMPGRRAA